jgi:hypothetical protein
MTEVRVLVHFAAPIERVFRVVSDHETFLGGRGTTTRISRPGSPDPNGLGCQREVRAPAGVRFLEEVTAWDPPSRYEYVIRRMPPGFHHERGWLQLTARGNGTDVEWTSRFDVRVPLVGAPIAALVKRLFTNVFTTFLTAARTRMEEGAAGTEARA